MAYVKAGKTTEAIADFNNALYLKGLSEADRNQAIAAKDAAYKAAGVAVAASPAVEPVPAVAPAAKPAKVATKAAAASPLNAQENLPWTDQPLAARPVASPSPADQPVANVTPAVTPAVAAPAGDSPFNSMLGGLFNLGQVTPPAPAAVDTPPAAQAEPLPAAVATTASTAPPNWKTASAARVEPASVSPILPKHAKMGGIYVQVASLRTTSEANAMATKLSGDHAATLGSIGSVIAPVVLGNEGTFFAVQFGPVASKAAGKSLCAKLLKEGVDCYFATP